MKAILNLFIAGITLLLGSCNQSPDKTVKAEVIEKQVAAVAVYDANPGKPEYLTVQTFKQKVWDYEANPDEWVYSGELPAIVDFYADWCKPCRIVAPIMDDIAAQYEGRLRVFKVDTEAQKELASVFQIRSIPSILFAPMDGRPAMQPGALSKEEYVRIIEEFVLKVNDQNNKQKES